MKLSAILILSTLVLGCAQSKQKPEVQPPQVTRPDAAQAKLAEAATSISHSLVRLAEIEEAANPQAVVPLPPNPADFNLDKPVTIDWSGPIEPLVKRLARANDYSVRVIGPRPTIPILISVNVKNTAAGEVLRNVHYQARHRADVVVIPEESIIEVRYPPVG